MKNKILLIILLTLTLSSCLDKVEKKISETNSGEVLKVIEETNSGELDNINTETGSLVEIVDNSGALDTEKDTEIIKEKEPLKEIMKDKEVKTENTTVITTENLLDDVSENYDKEIEDEILKLFE